MVAQYAQPPDDLLGGEDILESLLADQQADQQANQDAIQEVQVAREMVNLVKAQVQLEGSQLMWSHMLRSADEMVGFLQQML